MNQKIIVIVIVVLILYYSLSKANTINPTTMQPLDNNVRGQRNRNPLNIKKGGTSDWLGTVGYDEQGHAIFSSVEYGTRAALKDIQGKINRGINTINKLVKIWAEANTDNYANYVATNSKIDKNKVLTFDKETMRRVVYYMAIWESKYKLSAEQYDKAWSLLS